MSPLVSRYSLGTLSSQSITFTSIPALGMVGRASFMKCAYVKSSPRMFLMNGNTR